jgi:hypothetical protein
MCAAYVAAAHLPFKPNIFTHTHTHNIMQLLPVSAFRGEGEGNEPPLSREQLRERRQTVGLPGDGFLVANLNRPFKVEPGIFGV